MCPIASCSFILPPPPREVPGGARGCPGAVKLTLCRSVPYGDYTVHLPYPIPHTTIPHTVLSLTFHRAPSPSPPLPSPLPPIQRRVMPSLGKNMSYPFICLYSTFLLPANPSLLPASSFIYQTLFFPRLHFFSFLP